MKVIEFIGAPGVGKSTILKAAITRRQKNDQWYTPKELKIKIAKDLKYNYSTSLKKKLILFMLKNNFLKKGQNYLALKVLSAYKKVSFNKCFKPYDELVRILLEKFVEKSKHPSTIQAKIISHYIKILDDYILFDYFDIDETVVYEEGIIHNNGGILKFNGNLSDIFNEKSTPAGIIHCKLSANETARRRKERGAMLIDFNHKGPNDLLKACDQSLKSSEKKVELMHDLGVPVQQIDMANDPDHNAEKVLSFIREITQSPPDPARG